MKSIFLCLFALFTICSCNGQGKLTNPLIGIGLLQANTTFPIPLYKNENDSFPLEIVRFKIDNNGITKVITNLKLKPYVISEGDSYEAGKKNVSMGLVRFSPELKFRVIDSTKISFKVITNENTGESYFIKIDSKSAYYKNERQYYDTGCIGCPNSIYNPQWYLFETWERYLKRVEFIVKKNLKIYDKPNGAIIFEGNNNKFLLFNVIEVNGDWIKLKQGFGREFNFEKSVNYDGWTQWRDGNRILIEITEHTYE
jgi:hypothetical protein